ncbi:MAG: hypothetical protein ACOCR0_01855 [Haloferacaceae archaeon]
MPNPATLRDSTEIVVPHTALAALDVDLEREFAVTVVENEETCRVIGSPVEIKAASEFLGRRGVALS